MDTKDTNQHWVPRFLLKNFADSDGRVFALDIHTDQVTKRPPKHIASGPGFNEFSVGDEIVSFEEDLGRIETRAAPVLRRIRASSSTSGLTPEDRARVADFIAAQSFRTEAFYKGLQSAKPRKEFGSIFGQLWRSAFLVSAEIARRQWALTVIEHDDVFYLGDNPVALQRTEDPGAGGDLGFDIEGVEAFLPLSPKCALYIPCTSVSAQIISGYLNAVEIHRQLRSDAIRNPYTTFSDSRLLHLSQRVIRNARSLYESFTTGAPFTADPENVENLNYLQCYFAYSAVFSNRGDFAFARRVFQNTPQYRGIPTARLAMFGSPLARAEDGRLG